MLNISILVPALWRFHTVDGSLPKWLARWMAAREGRGDKHLNEGSDPWRTRQGSERARAVTGLSALEVTSLAGREG